MNTRDLLSWDNGKGTQEEPAPMRAEGDQVNDDNPGHNDDESREHRHNPAPYCAKCGGPCEMQNDG